MNESHSDSFTWSRNSPLFVDLEGSNRVHNSPRLDPILSQFNPVHTITT